MSTGETQLSFTIRDGEPGDEAAFACIQTASWNAAFREILPAETLARLTDRGRVEAMYARVLRDPAFHLAVGSINGTPHGITAWSKNRSGLGADTAELVCIHSLPDHWGRGFGSAMLERVLGQMTREDFSRAVLWVFRENARARRFYEKHGFTPTGQVQTVYGAEEMLYEKTL